MELTNKYIKTLTEELDKRYLALRTEIQGKKFTNNAETPWKHCMDNDRRQKNSYVEAFNLTLALADFNSILTEIKKLK